MKKFRTITLASIIVAGIFSMVIHSSCNNPCKDVTCRNGGACNDGACVCPEGYGGTYCETLTEPCKNITCLNDGKCINGICDCPLGYEGIYCETLTVEKYLGVWQVFEAGTLSQTKVYEVAVQKDTAMDKLKVLNFAGLPSPVTVSVRRDSIFIPEQTVENYRVNGWGILAPGGGAIELHYRTIDKYGNIDDFGLNSGSPSVWSK